LSSLARAVWITALGTVLTTVVEQTGDRWGPCAARASEDPTKQAESGRRKLTHEETLRWIAEHKAWRLARKTRPIWARPVEAGEVGKEFQTADHVKEVAREGFWLCVGIAGEPWFQTREKIDAKYEHDGEELKTFEFDAKPHRYRKYKPKGTARNWAARVDGPGIEGFSIRPIYDPEHPLYSPAGGYVIKDDVKDPYRDNPQDVWLVQEALFKSTYEIVRSTEDEGLPRDHGSRPQ
jgi:hypothetical protein